jgi:hypothetical protein
MTVTKKRRNKYVTHAELRATLDELLDFIFSPPEERDLVAHDALCGCGHRRDEHCGCGSACAPPANDLERAKMQKGLSYATVECECDGFEGLKS